MISCIVLVLLVLLALGALGLWLAVEVSNAVTELIIRTLWR